MVDFRLTDDARELVHRYRAFVEEHVLPAEEEGIDEAGELDWDVVQRLRKIAREEGLWTPHLPEAWGGLDPDTVTLAHIHQELGVSGLGSLAVNCMAPDEGNMHVLLEFGTEAQQERWLTPLAAGEIRSTFAMTEPDVAGSDPSTLETRAVKDGDEWVLNGRKWFATGAEGAAFAIVVAITDPEAHHYEGATLFLVPTDTPGWRIQRQVETMGAHFPGGHPELVLEDVRVPDSAILGEEGKGLQHAQDRLGVGRVTHTMRWIGQAQRGLDLMVKRAMERKAFGKELSRHQGVQWMIADSARELKLARLSVLEAAWRIDQGLEHRFEISLAKEYVAGILQDILDRAIQVHGALGYTKDLPLERMFRDARAARIYDGPDEVHRMVMAKHAFKAFKRDGTTRGLLGGDL